MLVCLDACVKGGGSILLRGLGEGCSLKVRFSPFSFQQAHSCGFVCLRPLVNTVQLNKHRPHLHGRRDFS